MDLFGEDRRISLHIHEEHNYIKAKNLHVHNSDDCQIIFLWEIRQSSHSSADNENNGVKITKRNSRPQLFLAVKYSGRASSYMREQDGAFLHMRLCYSPAAQIFLFLFQWTDCSLVGALGLMRILICKAYVNGKTTTYIHEKRASVKEFYCVIFPSLLQLQRGTTDVEDQKQKEIANKYKKKAETNERSKMSEIDAEIERECGICMEMNSKVVLPNCNHSLCMKCYHDWNARSKSCPFCRDSLKGVRSADLWIYPDDNEILDTSLVYNENRKRLFMYIDKLPLNLPNPQVLVPFVSHIQ